LKLRRGKILKISKTIENSIIFSNPARSALEVNEGFTIIMMDHTYFHYSSHLPAPRQRSEDFLCSTNYGTSSGHMARLSCGAWL